MEKVIRRPNRKVAASRRKEAREILQEYIFSPSFTALPRSIQLAILTLNPSLKEE